MREMERNVGPALGTTIVVFLVTLSWLFYSQHRKTAVDPGARAFALGYYLGACIAVQGQTIANTLAIESVRLAGTLNIPEQIFPGVPNLRQQDKCYDLNTVSRARDHLDVFAQGFFLLGEMAASAEALQREDARVGVVKVEAMMREVAAKLGPPSRVEAVSLFCSGQLNVQQLYDRLFATREHLIPVFGGPEKGRSP